MFFTNEILRVKLRCINRLRIFKKITLCNRKQNLILHPGGESPAPRLPASLRLAVQSTAASGLTAICGTGDSCKIRAKSSAPRSLTTMLSHDPNVFFDLALQCVGCFKPAFFPDKGQDLYL